MSKKRARTVDILGENRFAEWSKHRVACRGLVRDGDRILLTYETLNGQYGIPGGEIELGESHEACCEREVAEETGVAVSVGERLLTVNEFYEEYFFETHYFVCRPIGETARRLTAREALVGMTAEWVDLADAAAIFAGHRDFAPTDEEKRGIYLREYTALTELIGKLP